MTVIIGVDPHKQSHTAVAICGEEREVAKVTVRATCQQTAKLLAWAEPFGERTWAIESAGGLGYLLAQQADQRVAPTHPHGRPGIEDLAHRALRRRPSRRLCGDRLHR
jgi:hypothetical protein